VRLLAVEPTACPSLTKGLFAYDFGDTAQLTPLVKMYTLGHGFVPAGIHAGGLRYHGAAPLASHMLKLGLIEARAYAQNPVFEAAVTFARTEAIIPAPESAHAIRAAVDEALAAREEGRSRVILFNLSGHGHFDMGAYDSYFAGKLQDYEHPEDEIHRAMEELPKL
jgi:tryptophan synthase beta chain